MVCNPLSKMYSFRKKIKAYRQHKQRCNTFFMELVSRLCFSQHQPLQPELIERLMDYVTRQRQDSDGKPIYQTKQMSVFDDYIDDNPVFRSFLLQLLLKTEWVTHTFWMFCLIILLSHFLSEIWVIVLDRVNPSNFQLIVFLGLFIVLSIGVVS